MLAFKSSCMLFANISAPIVNYGPYNLALTKLLSRAYSGFIFSLNTSLGVLAAETIFDRTGDMGAKDFSFILLLFKECDILI